MSGKVQLLVFRLDDCLYGVRLALVQRVIRAVDAVPLPQAPGIVQGVINVHGQMVPVLNIRRRFGLIERAIGLNDVFIIAFSSRRTVALVIDAIKEVVERAAEDIVSAGKVVPRLKHIEGVMQLDDDLVLIHDLDRFLSLDEEIELEQALTRQQGHEI